ncbi:hypothetical protein [Caldicellulosiruptor morganii]|uniref:4Fe-4S ferredoxin-type domain-containing protein n=1 Tax=Caldicellulosiruptor morganii TaxID=1387555 RepID=A0ABY7BKH4_9FIRM|nr:hypothetical protein [Caldicellulosiruptor morganii]WAM33323.1 hypothetical protein OTK00_001818 [Caldicellulosiruptor morganii]
MRKVKLSEVFSMPSSILFNIPQHTCLNCGACCGSVLATKSEIEAVKRKVSKSTLKI